MSGGNSHGLTHGYAENNHPQNPRHISSEYNALENNKHKHGHGHSRYNENSNMQYAYYPAKGLTPSLSSPAAITDYLTREIDNLYAQPSAQYTTHQVNENNIDHHAANYSHSRSTGNLNIAAIAPASALKSNQLRMSPETHNSRLAYAPAPSLKYVTSNTTGPHPGLHLNSDAQLTERKYDATSRFARNNTRSYRDVNTSEQMGSTFVTSPGYHRTQSYDYSQESSLRHPLHIDTSVMPMSSSSSPLRYQSSSAVSTSPERRAAPLGPRQPPSGFSSVSLGLPKTPENQSGASYQDQPLPALPNLSPTRNHTQSSPVYPKNYNFEPESNEPADLYYLDDPYANQVFDTCSIYSRAPTVRTKSYSKVTSAVSYPPVSQTYGPSVTPDEPLKNEDIDNLNSSGNSAFSALSGITSHSSTSHEQDYFNTVMKSAPNEPLTAPQLASHKKSLQWSELPPQSHSSSYTTLETRNTSSAKAPDLMDKDSSILKQSNVTTPQHPAALHSQTSRALKTLSEQDSSLNSHSNLPPLSTAGSGAKFPQLNEGTTLSHSSSSTTPTSKPQLSLGSTPTSNSNTSKSKGNYNQHLQSLEKFSFSSKENSNIDAPRTMKSGDTSSTLSFETVKASASQPISRRIQRSQTYSEAVDDLLLPPPTRSYSTFSKSYNGSSTHSNDSSVRTFSVNSSGNSTTMGDDEEGSLMVRLDLPSIPDSRSQLDPSKLASRDFERCEEPWMISAICKWICHLNSRAEMSYDTLSEALIGLFRHTIPTLGWVAAERVTVPLLESLINCGFLTINNEAGIVIVHERKSTTGVLTSITGKGCYSPRNHKGVDSLATNNGTKASAVRHLEENNAVSSYHCYSSRCCRSIPYKPVLPKLNQALKVNDNDRVNWAKIWALTDEELGKLDKKVIERQSAIQEFIGTEEVYVRGLKAFLNVYGDHLAKTKPHVVPNQAKFWSDTFGCISALIESNDNQLLSHLKIRQAQQGPYISTIADVVLNWLKGAKQPYMHRASTYSYSMRVIAAEKGKNDLFGAWLDKAERDPRLTRQQKFDFLVASPFTRLCRYNLLFERIRMSTPETNPECQLWDRCIEECRSLVADYNRIYGEAEDVSSIMTLEERIVFPRSDDKVDLRLWDPRRKIFYQGDVLRKGEFGIDYVDTHMILLDHYLILAKVKKENLEKYLVSKRPIALDLLIIEQADGEPVNKSNTKMLTGVLSGATDTRRLSKMYPPKNNNSNNSNSRHGSTVKDGAVNGVNAVGGIGYLNEVNENTIYPIKIRDLGSGDARKIYYIYTQTEEERRSWVNKILLAKSEYASTSFALNAEPYKVRVVEDRFFGYELSDAPKLPVYTQATAVDRGIKEYEQVNGPVGVTATATIGVNGSANSGLVGTLGLAIGGNGGGAGHGTNNINSTTSITKTAMAMVRAQALSPMNCIVTCNVGGRFFLVAGLDNGIYACDMTMKRMSVSAAVNNLKQNTGKHGKSKSKMLSPDKFPIHNPYNTLSNEEYEDETDDDDMTAWAAPQWVRCLDLQKITQLEILTEYNVLLVLADRTLVWYHLDQVLAIVQNQNRKPRDASMTGYAISKAKETPFFTTGYMSNAISSMEIGCEDKRRELLFYRKKDVRETIKRSTAIEVLEPVKEKGSQKRRSQFIASSPAPTKKSMSKGHHGVTSTGGGVRFPKHEHTSRNVGIFDSTHANRSKKGMNAPNDMLRLSARSKISVGATSTEFFREYDSIALPVDSLGITLFSSTFFVHTSRGFELMALSFKQPRVVPDPASIAPALNRGGAAAITGLGSISLDGTLSGASLNNNMSNNSPSAIEAFKRKLESSKPVGAFMLSDNVILLVYDQVAIFVDKFGNMSLPFVINMLGKIKSAVVSYPYLVAVSDEMVEIRRLDISGNSKAAQNMAQAASKASNSDPSNVNSSANHSNTTAGISTKKSQKKSSRFSKIGNGKNNASISDIENISSNGQSTSATDYSGSTCPLKQVITGKHMRLVVAGTRRSMKTGQEIMVAMAHPKYPGRQLLIELVKNEFVNDDDNSSLKGL